MGMDWYNMIALKNGGYKDNAAYIVEGVSGEDVFKERLIKMLGNCESVLDSGCGHGEFTIEMGRYANNIIGFDNSKELIKIADEILKESKIENVRFVYAWTRDNKPLPFEDKQFDLIYSRRGPTSIAYHSRVLRSGGTIYGICPEYPNIIDIVSKRLSHNGFVNIEVNVFKNAILVFPNPKEFAKFLTAFPGNPNYTLPESKQMLDEKVKENMINGRLCYKQWRFIWKAIKA